MIKLTTHLLIIAGFLFLSACGTTSLQYGMALQQGKNDFTAGLYKGAMRNLLPLACDGNKEAQYAVGYMYYYGYGVAQDTDVGYFWISRSAKQGYKPAIEAVKTIDNKNPVKSNSTLSSYLHSPHPLHDPSSQKNG